MTPADTSEVRVRVWFSGTVGAAALAVASLTSALAATSSPAPIVTAQVNTATAASQCAVADGAKRTDAADAASVMAGTARVGSYGTYRLDADPNWRSQRTLDDSGNSNLHGLTWALPLLRVGVRTGDQVMVDRFYALLADWVHDVPPAAIAWNGPYSALPEGYRLVTLTCALAGPRGGEPWVGAALTTQAQTVAAAAHWRPTNNVNVQQSAGLFAAAMALGRDDLRAVAVARLSQMATRIIRADGSDDEGSPAYARFNYDLFAMVDRRLRAAGVTMPPSVARYRLLARYLAAATRPDGVLEAAGDGAQRPPPNITGTDAEWAATRGTAGRAPTAVASRFAAGFVFARSGWGTGERSFADETFVSLRTGGVSAGAVHSHNDVTALTLHAWGSGLVLDSGGYRYQKGVERRYLLSRAAHSALDVPGAANTRRAAKVTAYVPSAVGLLVTMVDDSFTGARLTRTVYYDRAGDFVIVWDSAAARAVPPPKKPAPPKPAAKKPAPKAPAKPAPLQVVQRWQLGADRTVTSATNTTRTPTGVDTSGDGANLAVRFVGATPAVSVARGRTTPSLMGWNSPAYGALLPAPTVTVALPTSGSLVTVLVPVRPGTDATSVTTTGTLTATGVDVTISSPWTDSRVMVTRAAASRAS